MQQVIARLTAEFGLPRESHTSLTWLVARTTDAPPVEVGLSKADGDGHVRVMVATPHPSGTGARWGRVVENQDQLDSLVRLVRLSAGAPRS